MRRTLLTAVGTVVGLAMLLSFKTHGSRPGRLAALGSSGAAVATAPLPVLPTPNSPLPTRVNPATPARRIVNGQVIDTQYGPVQLQITLAGSRIVQITPLQLPSGQSRDAEINNYAVPILTQEALQAQSARIDAVSGASYTSDGYAQSLQSALDRAHG